MSLKISNPVVELEIEEFIPLKDLVEDEVILFLPQVIPSRWLDALRSARLSGATLASVTQQSDLVKYKINLKKLEFEAFLNRLKPFKENGVSTHILRVITPPKPTESSRTSLLLSQSVASRVELWKSTTNKRRSETLASSSKPTNSKVLKALPINKDVRKGSTSPMGQRSKPDTVRSKSPFARSNVINPREAKSVQTVRGSRVSADVVHDASDDTVDEVDSTITPSASTLVAQIDEPALVAKRMSHKRLEVFEKKKQDGIVVISVADRENLLDACSNGDLVFIQNQLKEKKFDGLSRHFDNRTTLMLAAGAGHTHVCEFLLQQEGLDTLLNTRDKDGVTAIMLAAEKGHCDTIELLSLHPSIDLSITNKDGRTVLMLAVRHVNATKLLISYKGVNINAKDNQSKSALMLAIQGNHIEVVKLLLENYSLNINDTDNEGKSALMLACQVGAIYIIELLLQALTVNAIDVNLQDINGRTALILAAYEGHITVVEMLLQRSDLQINIAGKDSLTALGVAVRERRTAVVAILSKQPGILTTAVLQYASTVDKDFFQQLLCNTRGDFDVNARDKSGNTALIVAASDGKKETVLKLLQDPTIAVNAQDKHGNTPLMLATKKGKKEIVDILLSHPTINPNIKDRHGTTALMTAARKGKVNIVESLINLPITDLNSQDVNNYTALLVATGEGHVAVVEMLLRHPMIDVNAKDKDGYTALMLAATHGKKHIVELLLEHPTIEANIQDKDTGRTALMIAAFNGNVEVVDALILSLKVDLNIRDTYHDNTALLLALRNSHLDTIKSLLLHDAVDVNVQASDGSTVLSLASKQGMISIVSALFNTPSYIYNENDIYHRYTDVIGAKCHLPYNNVVELLLSEDPDIDCQLVREDDESVSEHIFISAVRGRHKDLVQLLLLQPDLDCNVRDEFERTPLMIAAREGFRDIVELLIESSVDLNAQDEEGCTALVGALLEWREHIARILITTPGVDTSIADIYGRTASSIAIQNEYRQLQQIL